MLSYMNFYFILTGHLIFFVLPLLDRVSSAASTVLQKLCTILGLLKDLLLIEKLSDSCILQLVRTSFTTFLVDNIQLLQLKAIALSSAVEYILHPK